MPSSLQLHPPLAATISSCRQKQTQPTTLTRFFPLPCWMSLPDTPVVLITLKLKSSYRVSNRGRGRVFDYFESIVIAAVTGAIAIVADAITAVADAITAVAAANLLPETATLLGQRRNRYIADEIAVAFLRSCQFIAGDGDAGSLREVHVVSGLHAASSTEKLEILDDERHVLSLSVVGGDPHLTNYKSVTTIHGSPNGNRTVVVESYVVDIPVVSNGGCGFCYRYGCGVAVADAADVT
ncbi:Abscisic acid receptor PYL2 [Hibiscus syriacus]|uniref:Abscisic acid receptor PYL2 n=1 Tax=Hibiscus syriacus TaxID=106335 RepID=A0A6A2ZL98_HIBSY|nr:Abscisic acid receptor PYL2 [Hibiscus syriacus]